MVDWSLIDNTHFLAGGAGMKAITLGMFMFLAFSWVRTLGNQEGRREREREQLL